MIPQFKISDASVNEAARNIESFRVRLLARIKQGVREVIAFLAEMLAGRAPKRTGLFAAKILASPRVTQNAEQIKGTVSTWRGRLPMGVWLEDGTRAHTIIARKMGVLAGDGSVFGEVVHHPGQPPRPLINATVRELGPEILSRLQQRMSEVSE